ncbi:MAG TPA: hypothetical protein VLA89_03400 [Gemmatimonadales bacterium]|nr:hypothetical protein [Gemmatimonadales bacterium]
MRHSHPFRADDLASLEELYDLKRGVIPMRDVHEGKTGAEYIAVRHDVDDNQGSFSAAIDMAAWEAERGYRTTYFLLHSASYWEDHPWFWKEVRIIANLGHEIGIHANGIATAIRQGGDPGALLAAALAELREKTGLPVIGEVAHGDELCRTEDGVLRFVNDEMFAECARPALGAPDRAIEETNLKLDPKPLATYGLEYDSNRLPRKYYASDSGGVWSQPWETTVAQAEAGDGQLHMLIHPDWWTEAF